MTVTPKKVLGWSTLVLLALLVIARLSAPAMVKSGFTDFFAQHGVDASIGDIELDLMDSRLSLRAIVADKQATRVFELRELSIDWSWQPLFDNRAIVEAFSLEGLTLMASKQSDGAMVVAGLNLDELSSAEQTPQDDTPKSDEPVLWQVALRTIDIDDTRLCFKDEATALDYCVSLAQLSWQGDIGFDLSKLNDGAVPLALDGGLSLAELDIHNNALQRSLMSWASLEITTIRSQTLDELKIDSIALADLAVMQRVDAEPSTVTSLAALEVDNITLTQLSSLVIDKVTIKDHQLFINKDKQGQLELASWMTPSSDTETETSDTTETTSTEPFHVRIDEIVYQSDADIVYQDHSMPDSFRIVLDRTELSLKGLDTSKVDQAMQLDYRTTVDGHGTIEMAGTLTPLADKLSFAIDGTIKGLDLRNVSAFTKGTIGYSIKSGQLDSELDIKAIENQLDSKLGLQLHHFTLKPLSKEDEKKLNSSMGLPLSTSLSLLRDRDNSIRLEIPIKGDLDKPDFDPADVINKATSKAITVAVLNYYTPLGLVLAADGLVNLATALRFEPVLFEAGDKILSAQATEQLQNTLKLLEERPGVRLTLCGYSGMADRQSLFPNLKPAADGKPVVLNEDQTKALLTLGEARAAGLKKHLVDQGIAADRLVLCAPEHEDDDQAGRVELSI